MIRAKEKKDDTIIKFPFWGKDDILFIFVFPETSKEIIISKCINECTHSFAVRERKNKYR